HDSRSDVADCEGFVLPPRNRVEGNSRSDAGDDEEELQESAQVDLVVLPAAGDVPDGVIENRLEEGESTDRRDERDDEQHAEDAAVPLVVSHCNPLSPSPRASGRRYSPPVRNSSSTVSATTPVP